MDNLREHIFSAAREPSVRTFVSAACGATDFSTGIAMFSEGAAWNYHSHAFSEAMTVLDGEATVLVEARAYQLRALDCILIPAGIANAVRSDSGVKLHVSYASAFPSSASAIIGSPVRQLDKPGIGDPENIIRFADSEAYSLSEGADFYDLFAGRLGAAGICGGYARFNPGSSLPCHVHEFDESISIIGGEAECLVQGRTYNLSNCDTAFVPKGRPHRFLNNSRHIMHMIWVYAGDEPSRAIVDPNYCSGALVWRGGGVAN